MPAPPLDTPLAGPEDLLELFRHGERSADAWTVGLEVEKFGVDSDTLAPMGYGGDRGALRVLTELQASYHWQFKREEAGGPVIGLGRGAASTSLEPGAQIEIGTVPCASLHDLARALDQQLGELEQVGDRLGCDWLEVGFHPLARQDELSWVPKRRYPIMREYLPARGSGALDMMRRTATVQATLDYGSEEDAMLKLSTLLRVAPLLNAMTANSPFREGVVSDHKSLRGLTWLQMDPARSGLVPLVWSKTLPSYRDYVEWALDAGMFFFVRDGQWVANTGQTFRSFLRHGYQGHRATFADWKQHLDTLFPEVRLRGTLEVRSCDALPSAITLAVPALLVGIAYDAQALARTSELLQEFSWTTMQEARIELVRSGLGARMGGIPVRALAEQLLEIAAGGLGRRSRLDAQGRDESQYLEGLSALVTRGVCPSDGLVEDLPANPEECTRAIVQRTRLNRARPRPPRPGKRSPGREARRAD